MERSQETVKEYRRRGRWERRGKRKRESPLFAPSHFPRARASSRRTPRLYLNNSVWTFSFIFLFLLAPEEGLLSNRNIGQFVEYIYFLSYCYFYFFIACEQAFGRAGNWGEGKAKRHLSPLSLPYPRYFFPKQRACSSWLCRKDQFAVSYFSTSLIVLIQVYNWEIRHHSLVCCCGLADILYILTKEPF